MTSARSFDSFVSVTEVPGIGATREQLAMQYSRYRFASAFTEGKNVLEVACGAGQGLGYLRQHATRVVGCDIDLLLLRHARAYYRDRADIEIHQGDARLLPYKNHSFDVVILFEAIYYLGDVDSFLRECRRVLRPEGTLLIASVNREWSDFVPSPYSQRYFSAGELRTLIARHGFQCSILGGFVRRPAGARDAWVSRLKRIAGKLHLIPRTMRGKQFLKRVFFGRLTPLPDEVTDGLGVYDAPRPVAPAELGTTKILYAVAERREA